MKQTTKRLFSVTLCALLLLSLLPVGLLGNADFTGDGKINMGDAAGLYAHIRSNI